MKLKLTRQFFLIQRFNKFAFVLFLSIGGIYQSSFAVGAEATLSGPMAAVEAIVTSYPEVDAAKAAATKCNAAATDASLNCHEATNPKVMAGVAMINTMMSASDLMDVNSVCNKQSNIMNVAKAAMTGFTAYCSASKLLAQSSCGSSETATSSAQTAVQTRYNECHLLCMKGTIASSVCETDCISVRVKENANVATIQTFNKAAASSCEVDAMMLASGAAGILSLINKISTADQCKAATTAASTTGTPTPVDCSGTANDTNPTCICLKSPRTAGCPGASAALTSSTMQSSAGQSTTASTGTTVPDPNLSLASGAPTSASNFAPSSSSGGGGGGSAAGGGGSGGGARGADASAKAGANQKSTLNPNILGGDSGGGGGGGGYRSGGSSSSDQSAAYKAYLPGGAKDPSRGTASSAALKDITGSGGEDNWNKVSNRYRDNKPTLMGE